MSCLITGGRGLAGCKDDVAGIKAIYVLNAPESLSSSHDVPEYFGFYLVNTDSLGHSLVDIDDTVPASAAGVETRYFKFATNNTGSNFSQATVSSRDNGTTATTQTLTCVLPKVSSKMEFQLGTLAKGFPLVFVERRNGAMFLMGAYNGCDVKVDTKIDGKQDGFSGYTLTVTAEETSGVYHLSDASKAYVLAQVYSTNDIVG